VGVVGVLVVGRGDFGREYDWAALHDVWGGEGEDLDDGASAHTKLLLDFED